MYVCTLGTGDVPDSVLVISYLCCGAHLAVGTGVTYVTGAHTTQTAAASRAKLQTGVRDAYVCMYVTQYQNPQLALGGIKNSMSCAHGR